MGKYLEIFHLGVGESRGLLRTNLKMPLLTPLKIICGWYPKSSTGREGYVMCLVFSGSVRHFDIALLFLSKEVVFVSLLRIEINAFVFSTFCKITLMI